MSRSKTNRGVRAGASRTKDSLNRNVIRTVARRKDAGVEMGRPYGARELAFRAEEQALRSGGHQPLVGAPFESAPNPD